MNPTTKIKDTFANSLIHFSGVGGIPMALLCLDGEKMRPGRRGKNDNTFTTVQKLAEHLLLLLQTSQFGLTFQSEFVSELEINRKNEKDDDFLYI